MDGGTHCKQNTLSANLIELTEVEKLKSNPSADVLEFVSLRLRPSFLSSLSMGSSRRDVLADPARPNRRTEDTRVPLLSA
jgi:hypothetical protein